MCEKEIAVLTVLSKYVQSHISVVEARVIKSLFCRKSKNIVTFRISKIHIKINVDSHVYNGRLTPAKHEETIYGGAGLQLYTKLFNP